MENKLREQGVRSHKYLKLPNGENKRGVGILEVDDNFEYLYNRYKYIINNVVDVYYSVYQDCVDKQDLQAQADLAFVELFESGWFTEARSNGISGNLSIRLQTSIQNYCIGEMEFFKNTDTMQAAGITNVDDSDLMEHIASEDLKRCVSTLKEREARVIYLRYWYGYTFSTIAKILDISPAKAGEIHRGAIYKMSNYPRVGTIRHY